MKPHRRTEPAGDAGVFPFPAPEKLCADGHSPQQRIARLADGTRVQKCARCGATLGTIDDGDDAA